MPQELSEVITRRLCLSGVPLSLYHMAVEAEARARVWEVLEVGPGRRFLSLTAAGEYMNSLPEWVEGRGAAGKGPAGFRLVVAPGPPGYYADDSGSHFSAQRQGGGRAPFEGKLFGPVIIEGTPGRELPTFELSPAGKGLFNQKALFVTGSSDATFKRISFRGFRDASGSGNLAAIRLGENTPGVPLRSHITMEDCEFAGCDNGIMGGAPGQSLTIRRCHFHNNGNSSGRVHNIYFGDGDSLEIYDTLSRDCSIGHLVKSRAARTVIKNSRLIGNNGTESACLDVPDGGNLDVDGLICQKSAGSDAPWLIHYGGENQDDAGIHFHRPSSIRIRNLTLVAPPVLRRHPNWQVLGFANQSGAGQKISGNGSYAVQTNAQMVEVYGLDLAHAGLPAEKLPSPPALDLRSPIST